MYFNSHAHVERDVIGANIKVIVRISTHTLTWSVTCSFCKTKAEFEISTHTLTWSVTSKLITAHVIIDYFNSHAHVERD